MKVHENGRALTRRNIGFLPQAFEVRSDLSVLDCILLGRREDLGWRVEPDTIAQAEILLKQFRLADFSARSMYALSGG